ncbi:CRISPR-associated DxTHG motif protein [Sulfurospirillum sp. T05]|uniref:CRISPR-associated DxTHG motif protein n=1 Tax=Sulfurospirillum tamanense TaxID=2813362 RepID=A0ABS2WNJ7_9BACT|nr:CRISPR-associated DxTHG motif protein [Sulfurospirillum tamanensis]
MTHGFNFLQI